MEIKRGQIWYVDLGKSIGSVQGGRRPCLVIGNDIGNAKSPTILVAPITSKHTKAKIPTHIWLSVTSGLAVNSMVMLEQTTTIDKQQLEKYVGTIQQGEQKLVDKGILINFFGV